MRPEEARVPEGWPPPPHDPRERELALHLDDWQVRVFTGQHAEYFIPRGLWHLQLWHAERRISVLTPSRLTCGHYEAFPIAGWKGRRSRYDALASVVVEAYAIDLPAEHRFRPVELSLVDAIVRSSRESPS